MDAPRGRYSVIEKGGRLIVIDNGTGEPLPSTLAPPRRRPGSPEAALVGAQAGPIDRAADLLVALAARETDSEGRAVIAWEWRENGKVKRWDAALDDGQQRRMGRALLALASAPLLLVLALLLGGSLFGLALVVALPPLAWGALSLRRLRSETHDPGRQG